MNEVEIRLAVYLLIKQHGNDAEYMARERAHTLLAAGDQLGCADFLKVARAIKALSPQKPRESGGAN